MTIRTNTPNLLDNPPVPVQAKLAAAWTSFMFLYIYVDFFNLYKPGVVDGILNGLVWRFDISSTLLTIMLASVAIPALMVVLSMTLPARVNRATNLVVASLLHPLLDVQRGRGDLGVGLLLRPLHRNRGAAPGLHPALRLDMASNPRRPSRSRDDRPSTGPSTVGIRAKSYGVKPAAADTGPTVTSSVAVCAENLLTNGPVSARGLTGRWTTPVMGGPCGRQS